jgi:hypothetical protein
VVITPRRDTSTSTKLKVWITYTGNGTPSDRCAGTALVTDGTSAVSAEGAAGDLCVVLHEEHLLVPLSRAELGPL